MKWVNAGGINHCVDPETKVASCGKPGLDPSKLPPYVGLDEDCEHCLQYGDRNGWSRR